MEDFEKRLLDAANGKPEVKGLKSAQSRGEHRRLLYPFAFDVECIGTQCTRA